MRRAAQILRLRLLLLCCEAPLWAPADDADLLLLAAQEGGHDVLLEECLAKEVVKPSSSSSSSILLLLLRCLKILLLTFRIFWIFLWYCDKSKCYSVIYTCVYIFKAMLKMEENLFGSTAECSLGVQWFGKKNCFWQGSPLIKVGEKIFF